MFAGLDFKHWFERFIDHWVQDSYVSLSLLAYIKAPVAIISLLDNNGQTAFAPEMQYNIQRVVLCWVHPRVNSSWHLSANQFAIKLAFNCVSQCASMCKYYCAFRCIYT